MDHERRPGRCPGRAPRALAAMLACLTLGLVLGSAGALAGRNTGRNEPLDPRVQRILERIDRAEANLESLKADVTETRRLSVLAEPERLRGVLWFQRPEKLRWDYTSPSSRSYVLADGRMTGWLPDSNRVEVIDLSTRQRRLRRLFAIGQDSKSLRAEFDLSSPEKSSLSGTSELVLVPKSRRLRKRLSELRLWIDDQNGLPRQLRYRTGDGDEVRLELDAIVINGEIPTGKFELEVPPGARVVRGLSDFGLPGMVERDADGQL